MHKVRVLVANRPRLMRELVLATIADQPDIEVVGVVEDQTSIMEIVGEAHPDFLIVNLDKADRRPEICDLLLDRFPQLKVLALAAQQNNSIVYSVSQDIHADCVETSEEGILNALRGRKTHGAEPHFSRDPKAN